MFTHVWRGIGFGGYGAPIVADGKVFVYVIKGDYKALCRSPYRQDIYVKLGLDPRALGLDYKMARDTLLCFDAKTGKNSAASRNIGTTNRLSKSGHGKYALLP